MLAVIADDFTGAAELGGIGLAYGYTVEIAMSVNPASTADLLLISTDVRSGSESEAVEEMVTVSRALLPLKPQLIYKKVDSVLRGHVMAEALAQLTVLGLTKALIVPANPALGRTLVNGLYYVQGELIHQTHFSADPEFPVTESDVQKRFSERVNRLTIQPHYGSFSTADIIIGEVSDEADLPAWVERIDEQTLPCGGSGFFTAILDAHTGAKPKKTAPVSLGNRRLYVCGSAFGASVELVRRAALAGLAVCYMPGELTRSGTLASNDVTGWAAEIGRQWQAHQQVIVAIDPATVARDTGVAVHLRNTMARAIRLALSNVAIDELIIEGGSTAAAVLREIGVMRLAPTHELAPGVVRSKALDNDTLHITVKPGSYRWPPDLWT
ncbi:four-carbon acid sugar kinase family protein [Fibrella forsythiae]|uniref:Four-carbon acid sugar kinase family protein n=1 Tax=Fibrella forsythiae TaxID=2817061 RepID=A0ABS3JEQ6_9BACT|nr:four-carbon acid sugar kinase family protein [Fibrella forsythiae]MBO0947923.1 four-carbon acid sugar kinase family protein [Fibrella forsythiae]